MKQTLTDEDMKWDKDTEWTPALLYNLGFNEFDSYQNNNQTKFRYETEYLETVFDVELVGSSLHFKHNIHYP